jgi:hypothetical protein
VGFLRVQQDWSIEWKLNGDDTMPLTDAEKRWVEHSVRRPQCGG